MTNTRTDMQIDSQRIRRERTKRAWSQEQLAKLTGLGLRTVQRIESTAAASHESIAAIASVLEFPVEELIVENTTIRQLSLIDKLASNRLLLILGLFVLAALFSPPNLQIALAVLACLLISFELLVAVNNKVKIR